MSFSPNIKNKIKPVNKLNELPGEVIQKIVGIALIAFAALIISIICSIVMQNKNFLMIGGAISTLLFLITGYHIYIFIYDKVYVIEGEIIKVVLRKGIYHKKKDIYIANDDKLYIITIPKKKKNLDLDCIARIYLTESNIFQENDNTWKVNNPLIIHSVSSSIQKDESINESTSDSNDKMFSRL